MDYNLFSAGNNAPEEVNAVIEIPKGEGRIKYEYRINGTIIVDRLRDKDQPPYPVHYGGIPATLASDGDPLDILLLGDDALKTGDVIAVRPIAVFWMTDEKGIDPKIVSVPADSLSSDYLSLRRLADISETEKHKIEGFFQEYKKKDLDGKWSTIHGWEDVDTAHKTILDCIERWTKSLKMSPSTHS